MGVNPLTLMGDVTKTEFLLTIYNTTEKKNNNFHKKNSRVKIGAGRPGGVNYHLMTTPRQDIYGWEFSDISRCACPEIYSVVRLAVFELVVMNQQAQSKEKRTANT